MRKKLVIVAMVALVALVAATPTLAAGSSGESSPQFFSVLGTITAIGTDPDPDTITVEVLDGSRLVWLDLEGGTLTVEMSSSTLYYEGTPDGREPIKFGDLAVGDTINIHGRVVDGAFIADRVTVEVEGP